MKRSLVLGLAAGLSIVVTSVSVPPATAAGSIDQSPAGVGLSASLRDSLGFSNNASTTARLGALSEGEAAASLREFGAALLPDEQIELRARDRVAAEVQSALQSIRSKDGGYAGVWTDHKAGQLVLMVTKAGLSLTSEVRSRVLEPATGSVSRSSRILL